VSLWKVLFGVRNHDFVNLSHIRPSTVTSYLPRCCGPVHGHRSDASIVKPALTIDRSALSDGRAVSPKTCCTRIGPPPALQLGSAPGQQPASCCRARAKLDYANGEAGPFRARETRLLVVMAAEWVLPGSHPMTTYKELLAQKQALDAAIAQARKAEAGAALQLIQAKIAEFGFTAQEVFPYKSAKKKAQMPAKYHNPNTGQTWTGRGKPPSWIAGQDRAQFEIR